MSSDQNDYNKGGLVAFVLSMLASFGIMIYVAYFSGGIDLKEIREKAAGAQQQQAQAGGAPAVDVSKVTEPWNPAPELIEHGKQLYSMNCAMCHGASGQGDGPAGASLNPKPRNLVEGKWKKGGTRLGIFEVLQNGLPPSSMQSYKHLPVVDRWSLVHYVRSISKNATKDNDADVAAKAPNLK